MNWQLIPTIANNRMQYKYDIAKPKREYITIIFQQIQPAAYIHWE